jgi:hypothetical protein
MNYVFDSNVILIAAPRLAERLFQHTLTAVSEFVFICSQVNHLLALSLIRHRFVFFFDGHNLDLRFDAESIFAVAFSCNRIIPDRKQAIRLPTGSVSQTRVARCKKLRSDGGFVGLKHHFVISR